MRDMKRTGKNEGGGPSEKYYVLTPVTLSNLFFSFSLFPFPPSPPPLMVSSSLLSQPRFVAHPTPSDLSSLFPPLHITSARSRPHMLTACYPS